MNYITAEQFLQQPEEVQKVLLEWWQPRIGDLTTGRYKSIDVIEQPREIEAVKIYKGQPYTIPLFSESQLRKFIEEKLNGKVDCVYWGDDYEIRIFDRVEYDEKIKGYLMNETDLLQAYWKVACMIAKE